MHIRFNIRFVSHGDFAIVKDNKENVWKNWILYMEKKKTSITAVSYKWN